MRSRLALCTLALSLAACGGGGSSNPDGGGGNNGAQYFACDVGASTATHYCYEWSWNGPVTAADAYKGVCTSNGATNVSSCPSSGKVGGCKYTATSGNVTVTWTGWFYFGTAAQDMQACVSPGGGVTATWVGP